MSSKDLVVTKTTAILLQSPIDKSAISFRPWSCNVCGVPPPALRLHVPYSRSSWTIRYCIEGARWRGVNGNLCLWSTAPLSAVQQLQELTNQQLAGSVYHRVHYHAASPLTNPRLIHAQALTLLWYDYDDAKGPVNNFVSVCDTANLLDYKIFSVLCRHSVSILRAHPVHTRTSSLKYCSGGDAPACLLPLYI